MRSRKGDVKESKKEVENPHLLSKGKAHLGKGSQTFTYQETRAQLHIVEQHMLAGASEFTIAKVMRERHRAGFRRVQTIMGRIKETWAREDANVRGSWKSAAMRRLYGHIQKASGHRDPETLAWITPPNHSAISKYESLLADIQGTREPIKIDLEVRVSEAVLQVITTMGQDQVLEELSEYKENLALAERYRRLAPQLPEGDLAKKAG